MRRDRLSSIVYCQTSFHVLWLRYMIRIASKTVIAVLLATILALQFWSQRAPHPLHLAVEILHRGLESIEALLEDAGLCHGISPFLLR